MEFNVVFHDFPQKPIFFHKCEITACLNVKKQ